MVFTWLYTLLGLSDPVYESIKYDLKDDLSSIRKEQELKLEELEKDKREKINEVKKKCEANKKEIQDNHGKVLEELREKLRSKLAENLKKQ